MPVFIQPFPHLDITLTVVILWGVELRLPGRPPEHLGVMLLDSPSTDDARQLHIPQVRSSTSKRLFTLPCKYNLSGFLLQNSKFKWKTIHIAHAPPTKEPLGLHLLTRSMHAPFHIPRSHVTELLRFPDIVSSWLQDWNGTKDSYSGVMTLTFTIQHAGSDVQFGIAIYLGLCTRASESRPKHWARAQRTHSIDIVDAGGPDHDCAEHHVDEWEGRGRTFMIGPPPSNALQQLSVTLSFEPYALNPARVRKAHITFNVHRSPRVAEQPKGDESNGGGRKRC